MFLVPGEKLAADDLQFLEVRRLFLHLAFAELVEFMVLSQFDTDHVLMHFHFK